MSLDLGFLCSIIAVAHIQSVESFGSTAFYFSFLNILFKFSCSPQTNIAQIFIILENNYIIIFLVNCLYLIQLKIFYDMRPITCSRPRSCLPLFIFIPIKFSLVRLQLVNFVFIVRRYKYNMYLVSVLELTYLYINY